MSAQRIRAAVADILRQIAAAPETPWVRILAARLDDLDDDIRDDVAEAVLEILRTGI